jgi:hypothetical protein
VKLWQWVLVALAAVALLFGLERCQNNDARIAALKDSLTVARAVQDSLRTHSDSLRNVQAEIDTAAARERDSLEVEAAKARAAEALAKRQARELARRHRLTLSPEQQARHDSLEVAHEAEKVALRDQVTNGKLLAETYRRERDIARVLALAETARADSAEAGWVQAERLAEEYKKKAQGDIRIFGLGLDFTCGPQVGLGLVTPGKFGAMFGVGCTIGK